MKGKCYKGKCFKQNHFRFRLKPGPVCWFRKRSELTFLLLSLGATGEQGISCYTSMALQLLTLASSDLKLPRGCWDTSCHIDDSLFLCVVCSFVGFFWSKIWLPLLFSSIQADSNLTENTTISSCCKLSADEEVRKKKRKKSVSNFPVHENCKGSGLIWIHQLKTNQQAGQTITFRSGDVPHLIAFSSCSQSITYTHTACHQQHMNRFVTVTVHFAYRSFHLLQPQAFFPPSPAAIKN